MPELPEVETIRRDLVEKIIGKKIVTVNVVLPKILKNNKKFFKQRLLGATFINIERRGKLLIFSLDKKEWFMLLHLRMTGQLIYKHDKKIIAGGHSNLQNNFILPDKYTCFWLEFEGGGKQFFNDMRQFGYVELVNKEHKEKILERFGPEPLTRDFSFEYLFAVLQKRKTSIKAVLLDQKLIAGIGNIYADESLFLAGILPWRQANTIKKEETKKLIKTIKKVLKKAIKFRGTTFNNYVDAVGRQGNFLAHLYVYQRQGKECLKCKKTIIKKIKTAGRGTHYCQVCQK